MPRVVVLMAFVLVARPAAGDPLVHTQHLRPMRAWIAAAVEYGARASPTMARLVDDVAAVPMIVHVEEAEGPRQGWDGRIQFVAASGDWLFLRIEVRRHERPTAAAIVAHELQHALEVHLAGVRSRAEFEALYRRSGVRNQTAAEQYDTPAAVAAGERTLRELETAAVLAGAVRAAGRGRCRSAECASSARDGDVAGRLRGRRGAVTPPS